MWCLASTLATNEHMFWRKQGIPAQLLHVRQIQPPLRSFQGYVRGELSLRLIARIDTRNAHHIKTVRCEGTQKLRKVEDSIQEYSQGENEHDELILLDNVASLYGFENWLTRMDAPHMYCPLPLAIGGGIKSLGRCYRGNP